MLESIADLPLPLALMAQTRMPVVYDADIGNDINDAMTLAFLLQPSEFDVRAVTTSRFASETRARLAHELMLDLFVARVSAPPIRG